MKYRTLGRTGIKVSPYCLGAMMFGAIGNPDHDDSVRIIHKALDAGINFVDTADAYSRGESEEIVGKALKGRRDDVVLATKAHLPMGDDPNQRGNSRRWLVRALEDSLRRLGTDHVDLFQIHRPAPDTDVEETLSALTDLVRAGKVRAIGTSSFPASDIVEAQWVAERRGLTRFRSEQPTYSVLNRGIEREVLPVCERYGMGALVYSPLAGGLLTGRYRKDRQADSHRAAFGFKHLSDEQQARHRGTAHPPGREGGDAADAPGHGVRDRPPRRHLRDHRTAHDGPLGRPARGRGDHADRRDPRTDRRDRAARHRHRDARHGLQPTRRPGDRPAPSPARRTLRRLNQRPT